MNIQKFNIYLADLNPPLGTKPGKVRPVVVVQTDNLNNVHSSTIICPLTSTLQDSLILRVRINAGNRSGLMEESDILVDQIMALDNRRFKKYLGKLTSTESDRLISNLSILILE